MVTVAEQIRLLLPDGSRPAGKDFSWEEIPFWPPDAFAVVATLVERSSAYRHVIGPDAIEGGDPFLNRLGVSDPDWRAEMTWRALAWSWGLLPFPRVERKGAAWKSYLEVLKEVLPSSDETLAWDDLVDIDLEPLRDDWRDLLSTYGDSPILRDATAASPDWWAPAMRLLITADAASAGLGFQHRTETLPNWSQFALLRQMGQLLDDAPDTDGQGPDVFLTTITTPAFSSDWGAVLPKTRTSPLGCTLRSLSHHLALLPPPGQVEARWRFPGKQPPPPTDHPLNLLLVPFPYRIRPSAFSKAHDHPLADDWGYFHLEQNWLCSDHCAPARSQVAETCRSELSSFVRSLVDEAREELDVINGVIFPEVSLDKETFDRIAQDLLADCEKTGFEFIVAGLGERQGRNGKEPGNFAAFKCRSLDAPEEWGIVGGREKHHRWKLDRRQVTRYGLSARLAPAANWWEGIPVSRRVIEFFEVRAGTSMTVLICEDLARADPCQAVVRAVGPNLVIALLMDGPQILSRWPAHYAGVLADDPGSTVLTFTSFGLIDRGSATDSGQNRSVALFKSAREARELQLPVGSHALALRLEATNKEEHTLDGRGDGGAAYVWGLTEVLPIRGNGKPWITGY